VQTQALNSRLFFRSQPLGTVWIDSPLQPAAVLDNLRNRGKEWRESAVPDDLKKLKVAVLALQIDGSQFQMHWLGASNPFFNPVCFGTVQPYGDGSLVRAGFKLSVRNLVLVGCFAATAILSILTWRSTVSWTLFGITAALLLFTLVRNRSAEPMRTRLVEVLSSAALQAPKQTPAFLG
jgi:Flp pilus assembly protein TadB